MTSSPGLRGWSRLQARRGVLQTTATVTSLAPYTNADNNNLPEYRDPQKALFCAETRHITYGSLKSVHEFRLGAINSDSPCFSMGRTPPKLPPSRSGSAPSANTCFLGPSWLSPSKRHLEWVSRFCTALDRDQQTDTQTDRPTTLPILRF